ncbi:MAG: hypothetical protein H6510_16690 [Acidobacteria bacterium]|nr:hypothetical protein [Acidobacteriota bacterium]MCB9399453.1 hypothetical protein [Acidobacteriota bacterium]
MRAFAYAIVLGVLLLITVMSLMLVRRQGQTQWVNQNWAMLEQAQLNTHNALNLFTQSSLTYSNGGTGAFEFEPENGFNWQFLPLGMAYIVETEGICGPHRLHKRWVVGARAPDSPRLTLSQSVKDMSLRPKATIDGTIWFDASVQQGWNPPENMIGLAEPKDITPFSFSGLAQHLNTQGSEAWLTTLKEMFPNLRVMGLPERLNVKELASSDPVVLIGDSVQLTGTLETSGFRILLVNQCRAETIQASDLWIIAKDRIEVRGQSGGSQCHFLAPQIATYDQIDFENSSFTAVNWALDNGRDAAIHLYGQGFFQGSLVALAMDESLAREFSFEKKGGCIVFKETGIATEGLIFSQNVVSIRGSHHGTIRAGIWEYFENNSRFVGRIDDVSLLPGTAGFTVWGLGNRSGEPFYALPTQTE